MITESREHAQLVYNDLQSSYENTRDIKELFSLIRKCMTWYNIFKEVRNYDVLSYAFKIHDLSYKIQNTIIQEVQNNGYN